MTASYSPHENGAAERRWQTLGNMARCFLKPANIPNTFWVRAVDVAFYLTKSCLSCSCFTVGLLLNCSMIASQIFQT